MNSVSIGRDGSRIVVHARDEDYFDVTVHAIGLTATATIVQMRNTVRPEIDEWFTQLAAEWRGWKGERRYESIERDLAMTATHTGLIHITVRLENYMSARSGL